MDAENQAPKGGPKSWLLIGLGVAVVALLSTWMWSDGAPVSQATPARQPRDARASLEQAPFDPKELDVRLEALEAPRPDQGDMDRNPFRFKPKAAPPPPARSMAPPDPLGPIQTPPPPPPQIPLKLMGFVDMPGGGKLAALSDCKGSTFNGAEGKTVDGQYRIVKIGIESVTIEFVNGKGRQNLRVEGCPPR